LSISRAGADFAWEQKKLEVSVSTQLR